MMDPIFPTATTWWEIDSQGRFEEWFWIRLSDKVEHYRYSRHPLSDRRHIDLWKNSDGTWGYSGFANSRRDMYGTIDAPLSVRDAMTAVLILERLE